MSCGKKVQKIPPVNPVFMMEHRPRLNFKNKSFARWYRYEPFKHKDNIVSSEWIETLESFPLFKPSYAKQRPEMVYLLSGEYGRMWVKEREQWYAKVDTKSEYEKDMERRKKKLRREIAEQKRQAEMSIQERKIRKAKEAELKAKAEAEAKEKAERLKAKMQACLAKRKPKKKKKVEAKHDEKKQDECPPGWQKVELTVQCECSGDHKNQDNQTDKTAQNQIEVKKDQKQEENCDCCPYSSYY